MSADACSFGDFQKLDLRIGKVLGAVTVDGSRKLLRLRVDLGEEYGEKTILSGIQAWYQPTDLIDKQFIFVANLEPREMAGEKSEGMLLCAATGQPILLPVSEQIPNGSIVR